MLRNRVEKARVRDQRHQERAADGRFARIGGSVAIIAFAALLVATACNQDKRLKYDDEFLDRMSDEGRKKASVAVTRETSDLAYETVYFRDHAGICWGLLWAGSNHGGPAGGPVSGAVPGGPCPPAPMKPGAELP